MANKKDDITKDKDVKKILSEIDTQINNKKEEMLEEFKIKMDEQIEFSVQKRLDQEAKKFIKGKNGKIFRRDILILILLAVCLYLAYCLYEIGYFNKDLGLNSDVIIPQNEVTNAVIKEEPKIPSSYYIENYSYLVDNLQTPNIFENIKDGVTKQTLPNTLKLQIAYKNLSEDKKDYANNIISFSSRNLLNSYKNICGEEETLNYEIFEYDNTKFLYFNDSFIGTEEKVETPPVTETPQEPATPGILTPINPVENTITVDSEKYTISNAYEKDNVLTFEVKYEGQSGTYKYVFIKNLGNYYFDRVEK